MAVGQKTRGGNGAQKMWINDEEALNRVCQSRCKKAGGEREMRYAGLVAYKRREWSLRRVLRAEEMGRGRGDVWKTRERSEVKAVLKLGEGCMARTSS